MTVSDCSDSSDSINSIDGSYNSDSSNSNDQFFFHNKNHVTKNMNNLFHQKKISHFFSLPKKIFIRKTRTTKQFFNNKIVDKKCMRTINQCEKFKILHSYKTQKLK